jgi:molybdenum cofactor biosynthesis protein B
MADREHRESRVESVTCAIITVSDTRTVETDESGLLIRDRLASARHQVYSHEIVPDDASRLRGRMLALCGDPVCGAVLLTGGTGLASRDVTCEVVTSILEKRLDGFGELFRMLSYEEVGAAAMLSRAVAGVCRATLIFSMPGSPRAVRLAMDRLILPGITHLAWVVAQ